MVDNDVVTRIAKKIRATRLEKKLTIQQLANRTRVSKGLLSKIENMRTVPSLPVFVTLIQSLDVSLKDFFKDLVLNDGTGCELIRKEDYITRTHRQSKGINCHHILFHNTGESTMEVATISIDGGESGKISTGGYVICFMLSGSCQFHVNGDVVTLNEGDLIGLNGSTNPVIKSDVTTSMLQVIVGH
jgi:transcriptional regulator with XRE-family HTH domain